MVILDMLMTLKNKNILQLDKLILQTKVEKGIPLAIKLTPQEAADLIVELKETEHLYRDRIKVKHFINNDVNIDIRFLLKAELTRERLQIIINQWYKCDFMLLYKDVELRVIGNKVKSKKPILFKRIKESLTGICSCCGSHLHTKWLFFNDGCLQAKCKNYYNK